MGRLRLNISSTVFHRKFCPVLNLLTLDRPVGHFITFRSSSPLFPLLHNVTRIGNVTFFMRHGPVPNFTLAPTCFTRNISTIFDGSWAAANSDTGLCRILTLSPPSFNLILLKLVSLFFRRTKIFHQSFHRCQFLHYFISPCTASPLLIHSI